MEDCRVKVLTWIAYACWALACFILLLSLERFDALALASAISLGITGVLFIGFDRVICLLTEIRDALAPKIEDDFEIDTENVPVAKKEPRSVEELSADLARLRAGLPTLNK